MAKLAVPVPAESSFTCELQPLEKALITARDLQWTSVDIWTDSLTLVNVLQEDLASQPKATTSFTYIFLYCRVGRLIKVNRLLIREAHDQAVSARRRHPHM